MVNDLGVGQHLAVAALDDTFITGKVRASLVDAKDLTANAFKGVTERGVVYLMGASRSARPTVRPRSRVAWMVCTKVVRVFEVISGGAGARRRRNRRQFYRIGGPSRVDYQGRWHQPGDQAGRSQRRRPRCIGIELIHQRRHRQACAIASALRRAPVPDRTCRINACKAGKARWSCRQHLLSICQRLCGRRSRSVRQRNIRPPAGKGNRFGRAYAGQQCKSG